MIFKHPKIGQRRIKTKFCWFPTKDTNHTNTYWLETIIINEEYREIWCGEGYKYKWIALDIYPFKQRI